MDWDDEQESAAAFDCLTDGEQAYMEERSYVREVGAANPDRAWITSDRDVVYPNPFYTGPRVPHPDDSWGDD